MIKVLMIGDIFGSPGRKCIERILPGYRRSMNIDLVVANGENAAGGLGITDELARELWNLDVDVITTGNHVFRHRSLTGLLKEEQKILRPANYPDCAPGKGYLIVNAGKEKIGVINLEGRVYMNPLDNPFRVVDEIIDGEMKGVKIILVDMHAEATSEKQAMGWHLDGRVSAVVGTHTHVQTADEKILPNGTGYITDLGLTGPHESIIGMDKKNALKKFLQQTPVPFKVAKKKRRMQGVLLEIEQESGKTISIERVDEGLD